MIAKLNYPQVGLLILAWFVADNYYAVVNGLSFFGTYYVVRP